MNIPQNLNIDALPYITSYQLHRLIAGKQKLTNLAQLKFKRVQKGDWEEAFQIGLAYAIFREIQKYNKDGGGSDEL